MHEPSSHPLVSVNVIAYNAEPYLRETLDSVLAQTWEDWECIIVDDASKDQTAAIAREYVARDDRFRLVEIAPENKRPFPYPRNVGLDASRGRWVAVLDSDDVWSPQKLAVQLKALQARPDAVLCFSRAWGIRDGQSFGPLRSQQQHDQYSRNLLKYLLHADMVPHSTAVFDREAAQQMGGYDLLQPRAQDWDLMIRLHKKYGNDRVIALPDLLMGYRVHEKNISSQIQVMHQAEMRLIRKTLLTGGWGLRHPLMSLHMIDGAILREKDRALTRNRLMRARFLAGLMLLGNPISRWRWGELARAWKARRQAAEVSS